MSGTDRGIGKADKIAKQLGFALKPNKKPKK